MNQPDHRTRPHAVQARSLLQLDESATLSSLHNYRSRYRAYDERAIGKSWSTAPLDTILCPYDPEDHIIAAWVDALDLRDCETCGHSQRVATMTVDLSRRIGVPEADLKPLWRGALLHDVGKLAIPDHVLLKTTALEPFERLIMERHPQIAFSLLCTLPWLANSLDIPLCHHERWDGSGYPFGLQGTDIPFAARVFAIVDVWDALRSDRPYRNAWNREESAAYIRASAGTLFDPELVSPFLDMVWEEKANFPSPPA